MRKTIFIFLNIVISGFIISCSSSTNYQDETYNLQTQQIERHSYGPYYQLQTEIIAKKLQLSLLAHLNKETIPGAYSVKKYTRRLLPNDYMAQSDITLYLKNLSDKSINLDLISISIENKRLPYSSRTLHIPANESVSLSIGQIAIDLRLTSLNTKIDYSAKEHKEKEFDMKRIIRKTKSEEAVQEKPQSE
ncbi:MAG: hypothetical protein QNL62_07545 [Gammaproteobacteria bacterium]|nr:hypothetical protein [Gammaproteobacteria bacterium]